MPLAVVAACLGYGRQPMRGLDADAVTSVVLEVGRTIVLPGQAGLAAADIEEKTPGELVTAVDRAAEAALTSELMSLLPGSVVIGEEACSADPSLLGLLEGEAPVWLVDPLDGTGNFIEGSTDFAVMVALAVSGETIGAWIYQPAADRSYVAERGAGAHVGTTQLVRTPAPSDLAALRGAALTRFLDDERRAAVGRLTDLVAHRGPGRVCAGGEDPLVAGGAQDFVLFWRTLPWDHAAGVLLVSEAGGHVGHLDGSAYTPGDARPGLLVASDQGTHERVANVLNQ